MSDFAWRCPYCACAVQNEHVTYDCRHDERCGGCGFKVYETDTVITDNTEVIRTLEKRVEKLEKDEYVAPTLFMGRTAKEWVAILNERDSLKEENARLREAAQSVVDSATPHYDRWVNGVTRICINRLKALLGGGENGHR